MAEGDTRGVGEELKGSAKKAAGQLAGNERMEREGEAQREKSDSEREAEQAQAQADEKQSEALRKEAEQRANQ
ncbi:MAG TPA: hypothetical protein VM324_10200 [Egibacteraceae bacterium]|jgi:uncharacterized protein YjbJ (UPF0337 family)|nr:hypothetical protein [Egibacteraceae bacterium]